MDYTRNSTNIEQKNYNKSQEITKQWKPTLFFGCLAHQAALTGKTFIVKLMAYLKQIKRSDLIDSGRNGKDEKLKILKLLKIMSIYFGEAIRENPESYLAITPLQVNSTESESTSIIPSQPSQANLFDAKETMKRVVWKGGNAKVGYFREVTIKHKQFFQPKAQPTFTDEEQKTICMLAITATLDTLKKHNPDYYRQSFNCISKIRKLMQEFPELLTAELRRTMRYGESINGRVKYELDSRNFNIRGPLLSAIVKLGMSKQENFVGLWEVGNTMLKNKLKTKGREYIKRDAVTVHNEKNILVKSTVR
jgi:hypothetical protein